MTDTPQSGPENRSLASAVAPTPAEIAFSCRLPLLVFFISAAIWLVIASAFGVIASLKFHSPQFLADFPWLSYGRVWPAFLNAVLYGCCLQAGLGATLWVFTHLGQTLLAERLLVTVGAASWNLGVTVGVLGILLGDSTGFENLEMPGYATLFIFLGYLLVGIWAALTFHRRRVFPLFVSQWFMLAALFWFPWIYSTGQLLLLIFPVRGMTQAVIAWWYSDNLLIVWLGLVGLAAIFYFVPKLLGRELHSRYLALFTFWMLILFGSWCGIPGTAPVPAWMPALSAASTILMLIPILAVAVNVVRTLQGSFSKVSADLALPFMVFGTAAFVIAGVMKIAEAVLDPSHMLQFTWFTRATHELNFYGFFVMVMFGVAYRVLPQLTGTELPWPKLARIHFWLAALGVLLTVVPWTVGGIIEAHQLNSGVTFEKISSSMLMSLRASTVGDLLLAAGHLCFVANLVMLVHLFYKAKAEAAYAAVTADLFKTAEAKP